MEIHAQKCTIIDAAGILVLAGDVVDLWPCRGPGCWSPPTNISIIFELNFCPRSPFKILRPKRSEFMSRAARMLMPSGPRAISSARDHYRKIELSRFGVRSDRRMKRCVKVQCLRPVVFTLQVYFLRWSLEKTFEFSALTILKTLGLSLASDGDFIVCNTNICTNHANFLTHTCDWITNMNKYSNV